MSDIQKIGSAGSVESNDCLVTISASDHLEVEIQSIVDAFFHDQIEKVVLDTLKEKGLNNVKVSLQDKGALDYTIKARLLTAIERMEAK